MSRIRLIDIMRTIGVALVAVSALSAVAVSSASAAAFLATKTGLLLGNQTGALQKFTTSAGTVECSVAAAHGSITTTKATTQLVVVNYSGCKFSFFNATVSQAHYTFNANGTVTVDNEISIVAAGFCTTKVKPQGPLSKVLYANLATKDVEVKTEVTGIKYKQEPGCPETGEKANGTYTGNELIFEDGGELSFDA